MPYLRDTAYVLKSEPYREHDAWVTLYGREHGKLEAVARGIRSWNAKQRGHLEPLTRVDVMIAKGASFDKLAVAHTDRAQTDLRLHLGAMATLGPFAHLVDRLTRPGVADAEIFDLLEEFSRAWRQTSRSPSPDRARLLYAAAGARLLSLLGYEPSFVRADVSDEARKLLRLLTDAPLVFVMSVTAAAPVFQEASTQIEAALEQTPLAERPHGPNTIAALLT
jgi:DNA repair protein RecO (recombination protein O)